MNNETPQSQITTQALVYGLGGERFAIPADVVREILDPIPVTRVPSARAFVGALINVRGKVVPLADLRLKFGMAPSDDTIDTRFIVVEVNLFGESTMVGIRADKVHEVTEIEPASLEEVPAIGLKWRPEYVSAIARVGARFVIIPNMGNLFELT